MYRNGILRWPHDCTWGHLSLSTETGRPQFVGFVRMTDKRVRELLDISIRTRAGRDMWEVRFPVPAEEALPVLASATT